MIFSVQEKYSTRLKAKNLLYIKQLLFILSKFITIVGGSPGKSPEEPCVKQVKEDTVLMQVRAVKDVFDGLFCRLRNF